MSKEIIGITDSGGRGSALVRRYAESPHVKGIVVAKGNDLMQMNIRKGMCFARIPIELTKKNAKKIARILSRKTTLVDVCQDNLVAGGCVNMLQGLRVPVIGATQEAGEIESDKDWSRNFMKKYGLPHPEFHTFHTEQDGIAFIRANPDKKWVIKAAGLALGKAVYVTSTEQEAEDAICKMRNFGSAGKTYLVEERLEGEEFSFFAVCDGEDFKIIGGAQDYKPLLDGNLGPNTGSMGCYSQPAVLTPEVRSQAEAILRKTLQGMKDEGRPYTGVLYLGAMVCNGKVMIIEFNARWGDPEAQVLVPSLITDPVEIAHAMHGGTLRTLDIMCDTKVRVAVALAAQGYPDQPIKGKEIFGIDEARKLPGVTILGAAIRRIDGQYFTDGGRVLWVVGEDDDFARAREIVYDAMDHIRVEDNAGQYRKDIGVRYFKASR